MNSRRKSLNRPITVLSYIYGRQAGLRYSTATRPLTRFRGGETLRPVNSAGDAFVFPFHDPQWVGKIVVQALILIIPIVGLIALAGWMLMTLDNLRAGRQELAPAGFHLNRGISLFGVWFLYALILSIPSDVLNGIGNAMRSPGQPYTGNGFTGLGGLLGLAG